MSTPEMPRFRVGPRVVPRVELVKAELHHVEFLYTLYSDPKIMRAAGNKLPVRARLWRDMVAGLIDGWKDVWVVCEGPLKVGYVGLQGRCDIDRRAEVSMAIVPGRQGRGIGREVLRQLLPRCDGEFQLDLLIANVRDDNTRAVALFEAAGFKQSGLIRRYYREPEGLVPRAILTRISGDKESTLEPTPRSLPEVPLEAARKPPTLPALPRKISNVKLPKPAKPEKPRSGGNGR